MTELNLAATRERILQTSVELFANQGYNGTTLRQITKKSGVNLAAVNYHFGEKRKLFESVISKHLKVINERRLHELRDAEDQAVNKSVELTKILDILFRPLLELGQNTATQGHHVIRLIGRSLAEPLPFMEELLANEFNPVSVRFSQALRRHVPHLSPDDFLWRLSFIVGALHHTLATIHQMNRLTRGICRNDDHEAALGRLIQFAAVSLTAPET